MEDFESLGLEVVVMDDNAEDFLPQLRASLEERKVGVMLPNTIMRCNVVLLAAEMGVPSVWVIHESWPQDQLDYYAKEVFLRKDVDANMIRRAFATAGRIVFPSDMQKGLYDGLYRPGAAHTIYNGIPVAQLNAYRQSQDRDAVRLELGYTPDDFLVLHLGTVCGRKGQVYTARACAAIQDQIPNLKTLWVGARYIRDHEIAYIDTIKETCLDKGCSFKRFEESDQSDPSTTAQFVMMDIQSEVLRFYMAADVVVVPSLNEVLPLVICEAMAFGRPVICSKIDGIPEAVTDGVEGFLVPPGNPEFF